MSESADSTSQARLTNLLIGYGKGDRSALDEMLPLVYNELKRLAAHYLRQERPDHSLQTTALVHEAYLRLVNQQSVDWKNRAQFIGIAAEMMRRILVNHARSRSAQKRQGSDKRVSLSFAIESGKQMNVDLISLDDALTQLAEMDPRKSRVVEMKFFGGMSTEEVAEILKVSIKTIEREWTIARAWLYRAIAGKSKPASDDLS